MSQSLVLVEQTIGTDHVRRIILGHGTLASSRLFIYLFMLCFVFYIGLLVWYMGVKWLLFLRFPTSTCHIYATKLGLY